MTHFPFSSVRMLLNWQSPGPMCTHTPDNGLPSWSMTSPVQRQWPAGTVGPGVFRWNGVPSAGGVAALGSAICCVVGEAVAEGEPQAAITLATSRSDRIIGECGGAWTAAASPPPPLTSTLYSPSARQPVDATAPHSGDVVLPFV